MSLLAIPGVEETREEADVQIIVLCLKVLREVAAFDADMNDVYECNGRSAANVWKMLLL